jgi:hypothetical protein
LRSRDKVGNATLTIVASTLITKTLKQMTASAAVGWPADTGKLKERWDLDIDIKLKHM